MRCIFCKSDSAASRSVEHIIPEALGNIDHVLPRGIVCDTCNNYFARKIEGPLLESAWFRHVRSRQFNPSKRGLVPPMTGTFPGARTLADVWMDGPRLAFRHRNPKELLKLETAILDGHARSVRAGVRRQRLLRPQQHFQSPKSSNYGSYTKDHD